MRYESIDVEIVFIHRRWGPKRYSTVPMIHVYFGYRRAA